MKLEGEYELTEHGVTIEGKLNNSHVHDVKQLFTVFGNISCFYGGQLRRPDDNAQYPRTGMYSIPGVKYRPYLAINFPELINPDVESKYISLRNAPITGDKVDAYRDANIFANNMGLIWGVDEGQCVMDQRVFYSLYNMKRGARRLLTNSAWIWDVPKDGHFKVQLHGLVNKHMMTVLLENATRLARYIDEVLVKTLDKPEMFEPDKVRRMARKGSLHGSSYYMVDEWNGTQPEAAPPVRRQTRVPSAPTFVDFLSYVQQPAATEGTTSPRSVRMSSLAAFVEQEGG